MKKHTITFIFALFFITGFSNSDVGAQSVYVNSVEPPQAGAVEIELAGEAFVCIKAEFTGFSISNDTLKFTALITSNISVCAEQGQILISCGTFGCTYRDYYSVSGLAPGEYTIEVTGNEIAGQQFSVYNTFTIYDNGLLDSCDPCVRGDADGGGDVNVGDATFLIKFIFQGGRTPLCVVDADTDASGSLDIGDAMKVIAHVFGGAELTPCD
ncbi:MAG: hypothetical protein IIB00_09285 [candidate division Zixibacteria bacterium]|nr:hypothetical protein [candidate division Zixibacteria bacterium]